MNHIDALIVEHCPNGVPFQLLGAVVLYSDTRIDATDLDETTFVGVDNLLPNKGGRVDASYPPNTARLTAYHVGDVLLGNIRPYLKKVWLATNGGGCSGDVLALRVSPSYRDRMLPEFLYYLLSSDDFFTYEMQYAKGAKMPRGDKASILRYRIPVPPVEVQREIVRVLDLFGGPTADLVTQLNAELEARWRQYAHYRDSLLIFPEAGGVRKIPMGELCNISRGRVISKDYLRDHGGSYPVYSSQSRNGGVFGYIDTYEYDFESITWTTDGANAGSVFYHVDERFSITNVCGLVQVKDVSLVQAKFVFYQLSRMAKSHVSEGMGNPKLMANAMASIEVSVPPLEEQDRIIGILDKFDALMNELSSALPAELSARRKQYEHYRDRLLTFKELAE